MGSHCSPDSDGQGEDGPGEAMRRASEVLRYRAVHLLGNFGLCSVWLGLSRSVCSEKVAVLQAPAATSVRDRMK